MLYKSFMQQMSTSKPVEDEAVACHASLQVVGEWESWWGSWTQRKGKATVWYRSSLTAKACREKVENSLHMVLALP